MRLTSRPVLCNYYVTYRCNAACGFCDIWEKPSPYVKLDEVVGNLQSLKRLGVKVVDFTGGEPLLHQHLHLMLQAAKELGFITTVTTNALLYPKRAKTLAGLVDMLHFSIDAASADLHDESRQVKCFDKVVESIALAKSLGERPDLLFTVLDLNIQELEPAYAWAQAEGLTLIINPAFSYNQVDAGLSKQHFKLIRSVGSRPGAYLNEAFLSLREAGGNDILRPVCKAASTTVVISPFNKLVIPCYHLGVEEYDLSTLSLADVWHLPNVAASRGMEGRLPACQGCTINCYMQPSFATNLNRYFWLALPSTLKYNWEKGTWRQLLSRPKSLGSLTVS